MQAINKTSPPSDLQALLEHATREDTPWGKEGAGIKSQVRDALYREQLGVCCYCMQELKLHSTAIDHFLPRSKERHLTWTYGNLILSCDCTHELQASETAEGKQLRDVKESVTESKKARKAKKHCDPSKGDAVLPIANPADWVDLPHNPETFFSYLASNGEIRSTNKDAEKAIHILNLNSECLKTKRHRIIMAFEQSIIDDISTLRLQGDAALRHRKERYQAQIEILSLEGRSSAFKEDNEVMPFAAALREYAKTALMGSSQMRV